MVLIKGMVYYVEVFMKEGGGGDNLVVVWVFFDGLFVVIFNVNLKFFKDNMLLVVNNDIV